jgi:hypothetical protein
MSRVFSFSYSFFLFPFYILIVINFSPKKIHAQLPFDLIFVQVPDQSELWLQDIPTEYSPLDRYVKQTRIVKRLATSAQIVNLTSEFYAAADPDISFDGTCILFAGKKEETDRWQIWRMNNDGSDKTQITTSNSDCFMPVQAGNRFYLDDPQPTLQIIYAGTAHKWRNLREKWPVLSLYGTDPEGKNIHRLTFNLYSDFSPDVLPDGRILFTSWQESQLGNGYALMGINNDGTDLLSYYEDHDSRLNKTMVHVSDNSQEVYFIESDYSYWLGGGDIGSVSQQRPQHTYRKVSSASDGLYHSPCPTPDGGLLSSYRTRSGEDVFSLYRIDPSSGEIQDLIYKEPKWHSIDAQILSAHPHVKGRSNWLIPGSVNGVFYCLNSYTTSLPDSKTIEFGSIKYLRVLEGLPLSEENLGSFVSSEKTMNENMSKSPSRILGIAPVEKDGSFHIRVPAETPVTFQLLDENYLSVIKQDTWTWVIGNENRGCIGCHEDRELSPPNILVRAVTKPAVDLTVSPDKRKIVDFKNQISPVIHAKCATDNCHVTGKVLPDLVEEQSLEKKSSPNSVYNLLLRTKDKGEKKQYVYPGNANKSPLINHLFELQNLIQTASMTGDIMTLPPEKQLTEEEKILFIEWIDTGAFWDLSILKMPSSQDN